MPCLHARVVELTAGVASLLRSEGPWTQARELHAQAVTAARHLGDRLGEAEVLNHNGTVYLKSGDSEQALAHHQRALDLARAVGSPLEQARALDGAGRCALASGDTATAGIELRSQSVSKYGLLQG